jgi:hypothetical protein
MEFYMVEVSVTREFEAQHSQFYTDKFSNYQDAELKIGEHFRACIMNNHFLFPYARVVLPIQKYLKFVL